MPVYFRFIVRSVKQFIVNRPNGLEINLPSRKARIRGRNLSLAIVFKVKYVYKTMTSSQKCCRYIDILLNVIAGFIILYLNY